MKSILGKSQILLSVMISEIDYESAIEVFLPHILNNTTNLAHARPFIEVLSENFALTQSAITTAMETFPQSVKDELAVRAINEFQNEIIKLLLSFASQKNLHFSIDSLVAENNGTNLTVYAGIQDIDYTSAVEILSPFYKETYLSKLEKTPKFLRTTGSLAKTAVKLALIALPQKKKDALSVEAVNACSRKIASALEEYIQSQKIQLSIGNIMACIAGEDS